MKSDRGKSNLSDDSRESARGFLARNERKLSFLAFVAGFVWDSVFITRVSMAETSLILGLYLVFIAFGIIVYNTVESKINPSRFLRRSVVWIPYVIQFMFGTLLNAALIFFFQSAELSSSWPSLLFVVIVVFVNEIFHHRRDRLTFQIILFFVSEFLYLVLVFPFILGKMGAGIFILSGLSSLMVIFIVSRLAACTLSNPSTSRFQS